MKTTRFTALVLSLALGAFSAFAGRVTVANVTAVQRPGDPIVDISYDLLNPSGGVHTVMINASTNSGVKYLASTTNFTGAVGAGMTIGTHKQVVWFVERDLPDIATSHARVRVTATDLLADSSDMLSIPAGTFTMGDSFSDGPYYERPTHVVSVSPFQMDKCEVTKAKWDNVYNWATNHGYTFDHVGLGKAANHPVQTVNWYDCVKWCNARSEMQGLTPCYYTNAAQTLVYRSGPTNSPTVNWNANGYRLPTEAEWEFAARGGAIGMRFPWSDANTITNSRANYFGTNVFAYDLGPIGNNPLFTPGGIPYTSPVGYFAPNGFGLYDMAGNVWEWCWDWLGDTWYSTAGATQNDPRGPAGGDWRVLRGGDWDYYANLCRVASRNYNWPHLAGYYFGFRCVRTDINDMVLIPAGPFRMGTNNLPYESEMTDAGPNHQVTISAFYMDRCEVSYTMWTNVRTWAVANGYSIEAGSGKAPSHPVYRVNWRSCVAWCNARSQKDGLIPCYYTDAYQTGLYRLANQDIPSNCVKWTANGYRLPTEAEWEKAARGGTASMRFPWSDANTIAKSRANYYGGTNYTYDLGPIGPNPLFTPGGIPYTSPVGYYAPNGYGLYDMAGNLSEWCWDFYVSTYYSNSPTNDPRGPLYSTRRVVRGGSFWFDEVGSCRVAARWPDFPDNTGDYIGFRCVRR